MSRGVNGGFGIVCDDESGRVGFMSTEEYRESDIEGARPAITNLRITLCRWKCG